MDDEYKNRYGNLKEKYEDQNSKMHLMQERINNKNTIIGWGIALIIVLLIMIFIGLTNNEQIIYNGYTIEQVTNATIQMCKALR